MKLTKTILKNLIREEIQKLNEDNDLGGLDITKKLESIFKKIEKKLAPILKTIADRSPLKNPKINIIKDTNNFEIKFNFDKIFDYNDYSSKNKLVTNFIFSNKAMDTRFFFGKPYGKYIVDYSFFTFEEDYRRAKEYGVFSNIKNSKEVDKVLTKFYNNCISQLNKAEKLVKKYKYKE